MRWHECISPGRSPNELRKVEMDGGLNLRVFHVAGTCMIERGTGGGSRGDLTQVMMACEPMLKYVPLHLLALEQSPLLEDSIRSWWTAGCGTLTRLEPSGWYDEGQRDGNFLWYPPPTAANVVIEQLGRRTIRGISVVVPRLMTGNWRKGMMKESDIDLTIPFGPSIWETLQHVPLLIMYIMFPVRRHPP